MTKKTFEVRFHEKYWTEPMTGCWLWIGALDISGYGQIWDNPAPKKAHRASYEIHYGPIAEGLMVCHRCDVRACVAPHHLFLGTNKENMEDASRKGRLSGPRPGAQGAKHPQSKLTEQQVRGIYSATGPQRQIAGAYGISQSLVSDIKTKKKWKHLHDDPVQYP